MIIIKIYQNYSIHSRPVAFCAKAFKIVKNKRLVCAALSANALLIGLAASWFLVIFCSFEKIQCSDILFVTCLVG